MTIACGAGALRHVLCIICGIDGTNTQLVYVQSYLGLDATHSTARFHGNLDYETLGGAGFASQRTVTEDYVWDLSEYSGIKLELAEADCMLSVTDSISVFKIISGMTLLNHIRIWLTI